MMSVLFFAAKNDCVDHERAVKNVAKSPVKSPVKRRRERASRRGNCMKFYVYEL
jgi:hypothetical protein